MVLAPELDEVIRAWGRLPEAVRSALLAMARAGLALGNLPSPDGGGAGR